MNKEKVIYPSMVIRSQSETIELQEKEIDRLNNVINELEKYIIHTKEFSWDDNGAYDDILDKLKELKEEK